MRSFVDLGMTPLCESYLPAEKLNDPEPFYPLHAFICERCLLVQLELRIDPAEIFSQYAYQSSYSDSWVEHMRQYARMACQRFHLGTNSLVVEVGSNDGYLLQHFVELGIPVLGIEPAANVAKIALEKGIPTLVQFFGESTARQLVTEGRQADLVCGANVLAQIPDLRGFVRGLEQLIKPDGVVTIEFPHLLQLITENQFDTIYHEHYSYFSLITAQDVFHHCGLSIFDVERLPTHGGSLRVFAWRESDAPRRVSERVAEVCKEEEQAGLRRLETFAQFEQQVHTTKRQLLSFLIGAKSAGKSIVGYGAPGKGNTLLNYCGIRTDFIDFTVDRNPYKQGKYLPGTRIPVHSPDRIRQARPDYVLILPWNLRDEIIRQLDYIRDWGGQFVIPIPDVQIL